jgi:osmotically-inducible protein OsmY
MLGLELPERNVKDRRKGMKKTILLTVLVIFGLVLLSGSTTNAGETVGEYIDDSTMHTQATAIVVKDPDARYFKIGVTVTQGEVVLTGFVNSRETEERLIAKIREIRGVKSVKNLLKVEQPKEQVK